MSKNLTDSKIAYSAPTWQNWSGNLVHKPASDGTKYYVKPTRLEELKNIVTAVKQDEGTTLRVSGQRHSQPPLVIDDNRDAVPSTTKEYLIDMSCYADLGEKNDQRIILGPNENQVTINSGVREDELDVFLTANNLMMQTVTAGGFFSLGGMTAVDVHGGTIKSSIFSEDVALFKILKADGNVIKIDNQSKEVDGWSPLQFARVSLGGLGIVTSIVLNVQERRWATSLQGGADRYGIRNRSDFASKFKELLANHTRMEIFFTPYATDWIGLGAKNFLVLWWNVVKNPKEETPNVPTPLPDACELADKNPPEYGAPYMKGIGQFGALLAQKSQYDNVAINPLAGPAVITASGMDVIQSQGSKANKAHSELWLDEAVAVIFMSYFIPLPKLDEDGLGKVWDSLDVVSKIVLPDGNFHIAAPMEFRFVKGGTSAMSGAYSENDDTWFVSQDLIGFVEPDLKASQYPPKLLQFFADVEREWVAMGGIPHNGKMYGFYDPTDATGKYSKFGAFDPNFIADLRKRRGTRLEAFKKYRNSMDPDGLFYNKYLKELLGA